MEMYEEFMNKKVKVVFKDGPKEKIARGRLVGIDDPLLKISGNLGSIIIHKDTVRKMGLLRSEWK